MRFPCVLICSVEDKEWLCLLQTQRGEGGKETLEKLSVADLEMDMCQKKVQNLFFLPIISKKIEHFSMQISSYVYLEERKKLLKKISV